MKNNNFIYGLEIHVQLNTKSKLFSQSKNDTNSIENTNVSLFDIGIPGTYPVLNLIAIKKAIKACYLMKSNVSDIISFDRKHYRYFDLPLSYQITQFHNPIGTNGTYKITNNKIISIKDIHIECDAAKIKEYDNKIVIDYNRCGVPLIEIVTDPCFNSIEEIEIFMNLLIQDLRHNDISSARFEMSQIRVDVNISRVIDNNYSNRLEIKNLNSFRSIKKSIFLAQNMLVNDNIDNDYTLHYNDVHQTISIARKKEKALDYMYYHDSSIPILHTKYIMQNIDQNVYMTIKIVNEINELTNGLLCQGKINTIINNEIIKVLINRYISCYTDKNYISAINLILEFKEILYEFNNNANLDLINWLINACINKKILKLYLKSIIELIIDSKINNLDELNKYLFDKKLIIDNNFDIKKSDIIDIINNNDNTLLERAKFDKKIFNYIIGIILSKYKNCNPKYIYEILKEIINTL